MTSRGRRRPRHCRRGHLDLIKPLDDPSLPWLGTLIGVPVLGFYYWGLNQYIVQRILGAKDLKNARWGAMLGGGLKLLPLFIMVLPGAFAYTLYPDLPNGDMVFPTLVTDLLPIGVVGIVLAGLVAAIMSSIDSTLNSASTLIVIDFVKPNKPDITSKETARVGRYTTFILMLFAALWAPQIREFPGIWDYLQQMLSFLVPPVVAIFLTGVFWQKVNGPAAFGTLVGGHVLSLAVFLLSTDGLIFETALIDLHFTIIAGLLTFLCTGLVIFITLVTDAEPTAEQLDDLTWGSRAVEIPDDLTWYQDYRIQAAFVLSLTVAMLVVFW